MRRLTPFSLQIPALFLLLTLIPTSPASADGNAPTHQQAPPTSPSSPAPNGNYYVAQTLNGLEQYNSIAAKIRYESHLHGQSLKGTGNYWQQRTDNKRNTRWEIQMQIGEQTASFLQIHIGPQNYLWTDIRLPSGREVRGLDVAWLQNKLKIHYRTANIDQREQTLLAAVGQGGLRQMMSDLLRNFDFQPPQAKQLNGLSVHALIGHWRPERLAQLWPEAAQRAEDPTFEWPEQIPHHVLLLIDEKSGFPRVCEHRSGADAQLATSLAGLRPTSTPLLRYEIYEVKFTVYIPAELFEFSPGDIIPLDEAPRVFKQLTSKLEPSTQEIAKQASSNIRNK